ncbi:hypothetical protein DVH24_042081 [Malus domestica]|uniref:Uncharacterized protein n=1 Tax=Malus domestica TaxID=3750 RepID=A0A498IVB0_MALDO|nr:hypothetical protein DVH24_042081 [Malus domestica]
MVGGVQQQQQQQQSLFPLSGVGYMNPRTPLRSAHTFVHNSTIRRGKKRRRRVQGRSKIPEREETMRRSDDTSSSNHKSTKPPFESSSQDVLNSLLSRLRRYSKLLFQVTEYEIRTQT